MSKQEKYIPERYMRGIIPDCLLNEFQFWLCDRHLIGYPEITHNKYYLDCKINVDIDSQSISINRPEGKMWLLNALEVPVESALYEVVQVFCKLLDCLRFYFGLKVNNR